MDGEQGMQRPRQANQVNVSALYGEEVAKNRLLTEHVNKLEQYATWLEQENVKLAKECAELAAPAGNLKSAVSESDIV